ncbi:hypothetical protein L1987_60648 [Smallanthus sonchifolius]|uniref:Uncharacterized protein n=1 Tax=Smallanthus sonchifolius TaxID=185202 RepID=A0ACB9D8N5_9ASTR|nr:hypothetical protein L1987_60648 [Smallanthus sonchifolius]
MSWPQIMIALVMFTVSIKGNEIFIDLALRKLSMAGTQGRGRGRGRGRPPVNMRQIEEHSHQDTEIHKNDDHLSHAE